MLRPFWDFFLSHFFCGRNGTFNISNTDVVEDIICVWLLYNIEAFLWRKDPHSLLTERTLFLTLFAVGIRFFHVDIFRDEILRFDENLAVVSRRAKVYLVGSTHNVFVLFRFGWL